MRGPVVCTLLLEIIKVYCKTTERLIYHQEIRNFRFGDKFLFFFILMSIRILKKSRTGLQYLHHGCGGSLNFQ